MRRLCLAVLLGLALRPALAADAPVLIPARDVAVTYRMNQPGQSGGQLREQRMRWSAAMKRMRIDPPTPGLFVLIDYAAHRMDIVRDPERSFVEMDAPATLPGLGGTDSPAGRYARAGSDEVAGMACTDWSTRDTRGRATEICVTADGVLLRVRIDGRAQVEAARVSYAPQDAAQFQVPDGYTRMTPSR